jgi:hypothetical protein
MKNKCYQIKNNFLNYKYKNISNLTIFYLYIKILSVKYFYNLINKL